ncbi:MAG TPA: GWxTD domain-containing protein [Acidobacteriota bacterium]|nr:GWxTD domain-containing protein [Acidobacteriota bacterium]
MRYARFVIILAIFGIGLQIDYSLSQSTVRKPAAKRNRQSSDQADHYKKWMQEDVVYIITDDEKATFKALQNDEERENFIEQFWARRNPDPKSGDNTFKEEHYRRIAYANEHFTSGISGWRTDRGRIYIMFGKPDELESHPTGGAYERPYSEGGGQTSTYPFEKWWYRHIEGVGDDIEIEFVDKSMSGEYKMALLPEEKDALINVPNAGLTMAEEMGLSDKSQRAYFNPSTWNDPNSPQNYLRSAKDSPFSRMERYFNLQKPPQIKFEDLKGMVTTHILYTTLSYDYRVDYIRLSSDRVLVPITVELSNKDLEFKKQLDFNQATVNVYGCVTNLTGRIIREFEDVISVEYLDQNFEYGKNKKSEYQHIVALSPGQRYKLELVLKDVNSKTAGTATIGLVVPKYEEGALQTSSIILANSVTSAPANADQFDQYVIGDMKILPNVKAEYLPGQNVVPYMQIYNMDIDQTTQRPSLDITFTVKSGDKVLEEFKGTSSNSEQFFYGPRVVLVGKIPLKQLVPGKYSVDIKVLDNISNRTVVTSTNFIVKESVVQKLVAEKP